MADHNWTKIEVTWFGQRYTFNRGDHLVLARSQNSSVCLFPPTDPEDTEHPCPRDRWIADRYLRGTPHFLEGYGDTAQEALDDLAAQVPLERMVAGGKA